MPWLQEELRRRETNKRSVKKMAPSVPPPPPPPPAGYGTISKSGGGETPSGADEPRKNVKKTPLANLKNDKHDALMAEFKKAHKKVGAELQFHLDTFTLSMVTLIPAVKHCTQHQPRVRFS